MAFQKLTYSGTACNNRLYLAFHADVFDTDVLTKVLQIEPTSVIIKKDPIPKKTSWKYEIYAGSDPDLEIHLEKLLDLFENKIDAINKLKEDLKIKTRLQFVIDIDIDPEASTPYFGLNQRAINFLSQTTTEVDFDLYKANTIGLLEYLNKD